MNGGEDALLRWLRSRLPRGGARLGDDTARLPAQGPLAVTVDQQIAAVHFPAELDGETIGRRLLAVNLSDLAASGARPRWALLALTLPDGYDAKPLLRGLLAACRTHGVELAGGDLARGPRLAASLTLAGSVEPGGATLARDRARPGHALWLGGTVGESGLGRELLVRGARWTGRRAELPAGLVPAPLAAAARRAVARHLRPAPQLGLGHALARRRDAGAAIDLSDGLALDLGRLAAASGVGAELDLAALRGALAPRFEALAAALDLSPVGLALGGGEDYVLLFTLPPAAAPPPGHGAVRVGTVNRGRRLTLRDPAGRHHPLPRLGWDHLAGRSA